MNEDVYCFKHIHQEIVPILPRYSIYHRPIDIYSSRPNLDPLLAQSGRNLIRTKNLISIRESVILSEVVRDQPRSEKNATRIHFNLPDSRIERKSYYKHDLIVSVPHSGGLLSIESIPKSSHVSMSIPISTYRAV